MVDPHCVGATPGRVSGDRDPITLCEELRAHVHTAEDTYRVGFDIPQLTVSISHRELHVRVTPHQTRDLTFKLSEIVHVKDTCKRMVSLTWKRQCEPEQTDDES